MVDAVVGAVIMVVATTSLLLAFQVAENAFRTAGESPINKDEQDLFDHLDARYPGSDSMENEINKVKEKLLELPKQYR